MATARAIFQAHLDGLQPESIPITLQWELPDIVGDRMLIDFAPGDNVQTLPAKTTLLVIQAPATNPTPMYLRTAGGAPPLGYPLHPTLPNVISWQPQGAVYTVCINVAVAVAGVQIWVL